ncbi:MAG: hypothetical protein ACRDJ1_13120 [Actinomycetota bacterium]
MLRRLRSLLVIAGIVVGALLVPAAPSFGTHASASHAKGSFPSHGFLWLDDLSFSPSQLFIYSDKCKTGEAAAWSKVKTGLAGGSSEFKGAWPGGISFYAYACSSTVTNNTDIMLDYMSASTWAAYGDHGNFGGHHHYSVASSSWCAIWSVPHPCGYHISRIHINEPKFDAYSTTYRANFLLHETGHSMGFFDYCGHVSIANNGMYCLITTGWQSVDRKVLRDYIYKNSPVYYG